MSVTEFQSAILRLLAQQRRASGESYVAGGVALNVLLSAARRSHDIDVFHDTETALRASWDLDRALMRNNGYQIEIIRETRTFIEAMISKADDRTVMQWACDSAFRFFPLIENDLLGMTLHPFDLATNKVLAMAGRLEVRDWIDILSCDLTLQPFGYMVWAACGKDPGYNPQSLIALAARAHYSQAEVATLDFADDPPDASLLGKQWHDALSQAREISNYLPATELGKCVVTTDGNLFKGNAADIRTAIKNDTVLFHPGRINGSWPQIITGS